MAKEQQRRRDFAVENHGSIVLVRPMKQAARRYLMEHTDGQWFGDALAVEPRYVADLVKGLSDYGFIVG